MVDIFFANVWRTKPVEEVPEIQLKSSSVMELPDGSRHFVGYKITRLSPREEAFVLGKDYEEAPKEEPFIMVKTI